MFRAPENPGQSFERMFEKRQRFLQYRDEAIASGDTRAAEVWKRSASSLSAAMTRLSRQMGWV